MKQQIHETDDTSPWEMWKCLTAGQRDYLTWDWLKTKKLRNRSAKDWLGIRLMELHQHNYDMHLEELECMEADRKYKDE